MDVRRRNTKTVPVPAAAGEHLKLPHYHHHHSPSTATTTPKASSSSDATLAVYLTNGLFFTIFFSASYFLLHRWRDKIRNSTPLHIVTLSEMAAIAVFLASFVYLIGFFGIDFVLSLISTRPSDTWGDVVVEDEKVKEIVQHHHRHHQQKLEPTTTCAAAAAVVVDGCNANSSSIVSNEMVNKEDEEIVKSVVAGTTPSYSLESKLGDCGRAARIRREAVMRTVGRSVEGLPVEGFDYESILGQCCEMPIGYVQIPVGIAGPLLLDGIEYSVPMATTEGCLVASTNRGCKAIFSSGGASSMLLRDGMTRAPVVRFPSAKRAVQLKFFVEDPLNFDTLSVIFNRFFTI